MYYPQDYRKNLIHTFVELADEGEPIPCLVNPRAYWNGWLMPFIHIDILMKRLNLKSEFLTSDMDGDLSYDNGNEDENYCFIAHETLPGFYYADGFCFNWPEPGQEMVGDSLRSSPALPISELKRGDIISSTVDGQEYVVTHSFLGRVTAAKTITFEDPSLWVLVNGNEKIKLTRG